MDFASRIQKPGRDQVFGMEGYFVWGGNAVRGRDGLYHLFVARWPHETTFRGWLTDSEIVCAVGERPEGPFEFAEELAHLKDQAWAKHMVHNPTVHKIGDQYCLFYIGTHWGGDDPNEAKRPENRDAWERIRFNQRIGLATAPDAAGPWTPCPRNPILLPREGKWDCTLTTNPSVCVMPDGKIMLMYKSTRASGQPLLLGIARAASVEGPYERIGREPLFEHNIEDPFVWREHGRFWMICKDMTGAVCGEHKGGILYTSDDGTDWRVADTPHAYSREVEWADGEVEEMHFLERPQLLVEDGKPVCFYSSTGDGKTWSRNLARRIV